MDFIPPARRRAAAPTRSRQVICRGLRWQPCDLASVNDCACRAPRRDWTQRLILAAVKGICNHVLHIPLIPLDTDHVTTCDLHDREPWRSSNSSYYAPRFVVDCPILSLRRSWPLHVVTYPDPVVQIHNNPIEQRNRAPARNKRQTIFCGTSKDPCRPARPPSRFNSTLDITRSIRPGHGRRSRIATPRDALRPACIIKKSQLRMLCIGDDNMPGSRCDKGPEPKGQIHLHRGPRATIHVVHPRG